MKIKHILAGFTAAMAGAAAISFAQAQQAYPVPPGAVYSQAPAPYPPGVYPPDYRRHAPNFDQIEDDEADATALPPPGPARAPAPILSPDDPRYANAVPGGPVMSPEDPRYGRPPGPPPVIYADRPPGQPQQYYPVDRGYDPISASAGSDRRRPASRVCRPSPARCSRLRPSVPMAGR